MAKFFGEIGYVTSLETSPGVWTDQVTKRNYYGDVLRQAKVWAETSQVNDNLKLSNRISIISDEFANSNFSAMRYVVWKGVYWKITNVEDQRPRLILSLGEVYNGPKG